jgi:signal transduction histidine kinase
VSGARTFQLDLLLAAALTVAGVVEVVLEPAGSGDRIVSLIALPAAMLPLAWRRTAPLVPVPAMAAVLLVQAALGGFLGEHTATPLIALVLALYSAGRHAPRLAPVLAAMIVLAGTRIAFDQTVDGVGDVVLTFVYLPVPLLIGRWLRSQDRLRAELEEQGRELERQRERNARRAAEEERMRIASDLEGTISEKLAALVRRAHELPRRLAADDAPGARAALTAIAGEAREALGDVRRALGVLRHDHEEADGPRRTVREGAGRPEPRRNAAPQDEARRDGSAPHEERRTAVDRALVAFLLAGALVELAIVAPAEDLPLAALTGIAIVTPLLWRRAHPIAVTAAVFATLTVQSAALDLDRVPIFDSAVVVCAAYSIGAYARRPTAGIVLLVLATAAHTAAFYPTGVAPAILGGAVAPWVAGWTVRTRRRLTAELRERAEQIERAREQEAKAAMVAERVRVARELHDAVAHNLSVIAIQAAGADGVVERNPQRAAECAALIETVGRDTLAELGRLVDAGASAPQPSLATVDDLTQRARDGGLPVELQVEGDPAALPAGVDLAAYRIVQEALANVAKHAGAARAWVVVRYDRRAVEVEVADDGRGPNGAGPETDGGHGLVGIRERVAVYDGTVDIGRRPGGGFVVHARLPVETP